MTTSDDKRGKGSPLHPLPPPPASNDDWDSFWDSYKAQCTPQERMTIAKQDVCLEAYRQDGTIKAGVEAAGVTYASGLQWEQRNTHHFRQRLAIARNAHADKMEKLMYERLEDPKGNRGSDPLLMFALKGERPDKWRELPIIIASDSTREIQGKLLNMVAEGMKRRQAAITVEKEQPVDLSAEARRAQAEEQVRGVLGPGSPDVAPAKLGTPEP